VTGPPPRLALTGFGAAPSRAQVETRVLTAGERLRRAGKAPLLGLGIAILVLPIPVVHFAVPPIALIAGVVIGVRRMGQRELFVSARGVCPFCGTEQSLGLSGSAYDLPRGIKCHSCLRGMTLDAA
jgi:hypothetical protein